MNINGTITALSEDELCLLRTVQFQAGKPQPLLPHHETEKTVRTRLATRRLHSRGVLRAHGRVSGHSVFTPFGTELVDALFLEEYGKRAYQQVMGESLEAESAREEQARLEELAREREQEMENIRRVLGDWVDDLSDDDSLVITLEQLREIAHQYYPTAASA